MDMKQMNIKQQITDVEHEIGDLMVLVDVKCQKLEKLLEGDN